MLLNIQLNRNRKSAVYLYQSYKFKYLLFKPLLNMNRPGTSISKAKVTKSSGDDMHFKKVPAEKMPTLQDYLT